MKRALLATGMLALALVLAACSQNGSYTPTASAQISKAVPSATHDQRAPMTVGFSAITGGFSSSSLTYNWSFGDGTSQTTFTPDVTHQFVSPGTFNVSLAISGNGRSANSSISVTVLEPLYYGEWKWAVAFGGNGFYSGEVSISLTVPNSNGFYNASGGAWTWCEAVGDESQCQVADGAGVLGWFNDNGQDYLTTGFIDLSSVAKLVAIDSDNAFGTEVNGQMTFSGTGEWYFYDGTTANVGFAMSKVSDIPRMKPEPSTQALKPQSVTLQQIKLPASGYQQNTNLALEATNYLRNISEKR
jgi:hypothetical protein